MKNLSKNLVLSGFFIALGLILPFFTAQIPSIGNKLLPMHIPVLLCGFILGWKYGLIVGFIVPIFRSILFGMPPMFPTAFAMAFELATYGLLSGLLYKTLSKNKGNIFISLVTAMIGGRIIWGIVSYFLYGINDTVFNMEIFASGAFIDAIPGMIIQLIIIPLIISSLERTRVIENV